MRNGLWRKAGIRVFDVEPCVCRRGFTTEPATELWQQNCGNGTLLNANGPKRAESYLRRM
jgi:hypothetical protein